MARLIAFLLISTATASLLDLADDADGPMLMQLGAGVVAEKALPEVAEVLSKPKSLFDNMASGVTKLEQRLAEIHSTNDADLAAQRKAYEHILTTQSNQNSATEDFNAKLEIDILELEEDISKLRSEFSGLTKVNQGLVAHIKTMQANLTTVQKFLGDALNSGTLLDTPSELDNEPRKQEDEHTHRLEAVAKELDELRHARDFHSPRGRQSVLELRSAIRQRHDTNAHGLIEAMDNILDQLALEQNASVTLLRQQFIHDFGGGAEHRAALLKHQAELNSTLTARTDLKANVTAAVEHLGKTKRHLTQLIESVRGFSKLLGDKPILEELTVSMLQTGSERHGGKEQLPDMKTVLSRPKHAFDHVNQHVSDLADQLDAVNEESIEEAEAQKAEFDKQLADLKENNTFQTEENDKMAEEIAQLDKVITSLRFQASEISDETSNYRHDLETMQANVSLSQEYLAKSLEKTDEPLAETADLTVLDELEKNDEAHMARKAHRESLGKISPKLALLQMYKPDEKEGHARGLLKTLSNSLDQLLEEHQASLDALKADFAQEFGENMKHHDELMEEFSRLNTTRAAKTTLKSRLEVAVAHLTKTNKRLKKRRESFLAFARRLAQRPTTFEEVSRGSKNIDVMHKVQETAEADVADVVKVTEGPLGWLKKIAHIKR